MMSVPTAMVITSSTLQGPVDGWVPILKMFSALLIVLGVMGLLTYLIKRYYPGVRHTQGSRPMIHVLGTVYLGSKRSIALIGVRDKQLVVGMTPSSMTLLASLKAEGKDKTDHLSDRNERSSLSFSKIYQFLKKNEGV